MAILPGNRIRDNGITGTLIDNPLSSSATVINSANLFKLSVVTGNHAIITLDPLRQFGEPEIVMVTAHSSGASAATVQRGMYGTTARIHPSGTLWVHAATNDDFTLISSSGTRPSDVWRGQTIYEVDTSRIMRHSGAAWVQDGLYFDPPSCRIYNNAVTPCPDQTFTLITFNSERWDTDNMHSTSSLTSRITFNTPGLYALSFLGEFQYTTGWVEALAEFRINGTGTAIASQGCTTGGWMRINCSTIYKFAAGEYVEVYVFQDNTIPEIRNLATAGNRSPEFMASYIGRGN